MTPKLVQFCDDPNKKYPQDLHARKYIHFSELQKNIKIQDFKPNKMTRAYVCMYENIRVPPPPPPGISNSEYLVYILYP